MGFLAWVWVRCLKNKTVNKVKTNVSPGSSFHCYEPGWFRVCFANLDRLQTDIVLEDKNCNFIPTLSNMYFLFLLESCLYLHEVKKVLKVRKSPKIKYTFIFKRWNLYCFLLVGWLRVSPLRSGVSHWYRAKPKWDWNKEQYFKEVTKWMFWLL